MDSEDPIEARQHLELSLTDTDARGQFPRAGAVVLIAAQKSKRILPLSAPRRNTTRD